MKKFNIIVPVLKDDAIKIIKNYEILRKNIDFKNLVLIGSNDVMLEVNKINDKKIRFINENEIVDGLTLAKIKELISKRGGNPKRAGWYLQQFIKLGYAYLCNDEYYLEWDSDTLPLRRVEMFNENGVPYFDMKTEYHVPYFNTINTLFDGKYKRNVTKSFISEHMIFKTEYVKELLNEIESNSKLSGEKYFEKIINSIDTIDDLNNSGFAEFETYGTYVYAKYSDKYILRDWKSLREGIFFFPLPMSDKQINWVGKKYNAISFEKHDTLSPLYKLWNNNFIYKHFSISFVYIVVYPFMQIRKLIKKFM